MNAKRILIAIIVSFVLFTGTDFLIHEVWLKSVYARDAGRLWKQPSLVGIHVGHLMIAIAFAMLWIRIALGGAGIQCAVGLGLFMGLFYAGGAVIQDAVQPLPPGLAARWILAGFAQTILVGLALFFVHRPSKPAPDVTAK